MGSICDSCTPTFSSTSSLVTEAGARVEPSVLHDPAGTQYQFERTGYFCVDVNDSKPGKPVFNRIVALRDGWAKIAKKGNK